MSRYKVTSIFTTFVTTMEMIIYTSIAILNVITFFLYGIDKWKAKKNRWRIPESTLLLLAVLGGSIGAWLGMKTWHHKTMHKKFKYGVPLILVLQIGALFYFLQMAWIWRLKKVIRLTRIPHPVPAVVPPIWKRMRPIGYARCVVR